MPWKSLATGGDITVADYIRTADLSYGDKLHVYNGSSYDTWTYGEGGLTPSTTFIVGSDGVTSTEPPPAAEKTLARGSGVWLERAGETPEALHLVGEYSAEKAEINIASGSAPEPSWNLVGAPSLTSIDLNEVVGKPASASDRIVVPIPGGMQRNYTYKYKNEKGEWGYSDAEKLSNGRVRTFHNTTNSVVPAGIGFWYLGSGSAATIKW